MDTRKSVQTLAETLHSLLGLKAHFTSSWVKSVCDIIKKLPSDESSTALKPAILETNDTFDNRNIDVGTATSKLKEELATLTAHINELNLQRRQVLNDFLDLKGNIRVFCRIRPINMGENFNYFRPVIALDSSNILLNFADKKCKTYSFDKVFHPASSQDEVFSEVEPVIKSALDGYNACIFAYGQTGTGKTFTMEGTPDFLGVVPRVIEALFKQAVDSNHAFLFSFSMLEIYLGNLKDLLIPQPTKTTDPMPPCLSIQTDPKGGIEIDNLVAIQVGDFNQALRLYKLGCRFRSTASTNSNIASSRSHCMIRISITCFDAHERRRETNKIWLIDLGGSERVLKTKAWGKRLEEGKAINLSLSALGDVINAIQRKKRHVPYRNSKLTQVLKDSLGEDSKTLMLVHVSPKEEDLCETICTLNFATRVRSIHLGNEDSTGVKDQKEVAITNLQQKMKKIENERQDVRRDIENLHEKLEDLIGTAPSSSGQLDASLLTSGVLQSSLHIPNNRIEDATAVPLSQLPNFMRPTICSRKKSGVDHQFSEAKKPLPVRRKRSSSHHAKSLTFPVKGNSESNSDCSISRTSCLVRLNMKSSADIETECSQDTSECDIKMVLFPAQESSARSSISQKAHFSHSEGYENTKTRTINSTKFLNVNNWLHLHKNESNISSYTRRSKWIQDIPTPGKKNRCHEQNKADKSSAETAHNYDFTMDRVANQDVSRKLVDTRGVNRPVSELVIDKQPRLLKEFFNKNSQSHSSSQSCTTDGEMRTYTQDLADGSSTEDNGRATVFPPEMCSKLDQNNDDNRDNGMSILHAVNDKSQCSSSFMPKNSEHCHISPSYLDTSIIDRRKDSGISISLFELKSLRHQVPSEMGSDDCGKEDSDESSEHSTKGTKPGLHKQRSQRALFIVNANQKDLATSFVKSQGNTQNTVWSGICYLLKQKIEVLCASALLGLGMQNLGFEHDFFHGLTL